MVPHLAACAQSDASVQQPRYTLFRFAQPKSQIAHSLSRHGHREQPTILLSVTFDSSIAQNGPGETGHQSPSSW
jgi:hypothetical protein